MDIAKAVDDLLTLAQHVEVAAHDQGRIVLKVRASALKTGASSRLAGGQLRMPGILDTSFAVFSRKLTIDYDPEILPRDVWEDLAKSHADPALRAKVRAWLRKLVESQS